MNNNLQNLKTIIDKTKISHSNHTLKYKLAGKRIQKKKINKFTWNRTSDRAIKEKLIHSQLKNCER